MKIPQIFRIPRVYSVRATFSHNVQVLKTKMVDFLMICTQNKIRGLVTI